MVPIVHCIPMKNVRRDDNDLETQTSSKSMYICELFKFVIIMIMHSSGAADNVGQKRPPVTATSQRTKRKKLDKTSHVSGKKPDSMLLL